MRLFEARVASVRAPARPAALIVLMPAAAPLIAGTASEATSVAVAMGRSAAERLILSQLP